MKNKYRTNFTGIRFYITHRYNQKCMFCCKGEQRKEDITKEIIDKSLDEIKDSYIYSIIATGGEPTLNSEMLDYLIDELIKRNIHFS